MRLGRTPDSHQARVGGLGRLDGGIDGGNQNRDHDDQDGHDGVGGGHVHFRHADEAVFGGDAERLQCALREEVAAETADQGVNHGFGEEQGGDVLRCKTESGECVDFLLAVSDGTKHRTEDDQTTEDDREEEVFGTGSFQNRSEQMAIDAVFTSGGNREGQDTGEFFSRFDSGLEAVRIDDEGVEVGAEAFGGIGGDDDDLVHWDGCPVTL